MRRGLLGIGSLLVASAMLAGPVVASPSRSPAPGSSAYVERDLQNMEAAYGRGAAQLETPGCLPGLAQAGVELEVAQLGAQAERPTHPALTPGALAPEGVGNPDRQGWAGRRGEEVQVSFSATDGALLQGTLFAPLPNASDPYTGARLTGPYPSVVVVTGSIQASAGVYRWLAEDLAERGYVVLTFDVQGQGHSETLAHNGTLDGVPSEQQSNFDDDTENAVSWMLSTSAQRWMGSYNPLWREIDHGPDGRSVTPGRQVPLAVIGHSTGAVTVSYLQGVDPRIEVAVALDKITATPAAIADDQAELGSLPGPVVPRVPTLGVQAEYGFEPQPYFLANCSSFQPCPGSSSRAPDPNREEATGFDTWRSAGVDSAVIVPRASTHLDFTDTPPILPASLLGQAMASYYVQAWLGRYLQHQPQAAAAMLSPTIRYLVPGRGDSRQPVSFRRDGHLSFYFCSGFAFRLPDRHMVSDGDLSADGCPAR